MVTNRRKAKQKRARSTRAAARPPRARRGATRPAKAGTRPAAAAGGLAPGMPPLGVYLAVANIGATIDFLEQAFGFTRGVVLPGSDGEPRYAEMRHGGAVVMLIRRGDDTSHTGGAPAIYTYVEDVDRLLVRAREAGAGVGEAEDKPWGDRVAQVTDPDGYRWVVATFKKLAPFEG